MYLWLYVYSHLYTCDYKRNTQIHLWVKSISYAHYGKGRAFWGSRGCWALVSQQLRKRLLLFLSFCSIFSSSRSWRWHPPCSWTTLDATSNCVMHSKGHLCNGLLAGANVLPSQTPWANICFCLLPGFGTTPCSTGVWTMLCPGVEGGNAFLQCWASCMRPIMWIQTGPP